MKKTPPYKRFYAHEFYHKTCQIACDRWISHVPADDIIKSFHYAAAIVRINRQGLGINKSGFNYDKVFRANRLLLAEMLVAVERSQRNPTVRSLAVVILEQLYLSYFHDKLRLKPARLRYKEVAEFITRSHGLYASEASVKVSVNRELQHRQDIDVKWLKLIFNESKNTNSSSRKHTKIRVGAAALYVDPSRKRQRNIPVTTPEEARRIFKQIASEHEKAYQWFMNIVEVPREIGKRVKLSSSFWGIIENPRRAREP
jgi:hypothetical protein